MDNGGGKFIIEGPAAEEREEPSSEFSLDTTAPVTEVEISLIMGTLEEVPGPGLEEDGRGNLKRFCGFGVVLGGSFFLGGRGTGRLRVSTDTTLGPGFLAKGLRTFSTGNPGSSSGSS